MRVTSEIVTLCHEFRDEFNDIRFGTITFVIQDGVVVNVETARRIKRGHEFTVDLSVDKPYRFEYNTTMTG